MSEGTDGRKIEECAIAISKALEGSDSYIAINALILAMTTFILTPRPAGPIAVLEDVVGTLRRNVLANITPELDKWLH
jgi:hypothetical protein